jgi:thiamine pyrophosphokinase
MKNKIAIIANGTITNNDFHKKILQDFDNIICADGGANIAKKLEIIPDYIIGDLDSIKKPVLSYYKKLNKTKIIKDTNPDKTDLELAIKLAETLNPSKITIFGAIGNRIDHTLANIHCLDKIKPGIKAEIVDDKSTIQLAKESLEITGEKNDIISVIPLSDVTNLNYDGFKWNVKNLDTKIGWFGISNKILNKKASINFSKGKILIIKLRR